MPCRYRGTLSLVVFTAAVALAPLSAAAKTDQYAPLLPSVRAEVAAKTEGKISSYDLNLSLDEATSTISGTEGVDFINATGQPQDTVYFRLYPNADYYGEGGLAIERARIDGKLVTPIFSAQDTVLALP